MKRLARSKKNRLLGGVCGGLGEYFDIDPNLIRLLWIFITLPGIFPGIILYILAWIIIPEEEEGEESIEVEYTVKEEETGEEETA